METELEKMSRHNNKAVQVSSLRFGSQKTSLVGRGNVESKVIVLIGEEEKLLMSAEVVLSLID